MPKSDVKDAYGRICIFYSEDGKPYLQRCPECSRENWAPAVATGRCAWCGYVAEGGA